jgi:hypothetical protein
MWWLALYGVSMLWASRVIGRRMATYAVREWPLLYPDGKFKGDGGDVAFVALFSAMWPIGLPLFFLVTADRDRDAPTRVPGGFLAWVFGTRTSPDETQ